MSKTVPRAACKDDFIREAEWEKIKYLENDQRVVNSNKDLALFG